jgi:hypothetical protein
MTKALDIKTLDKIEDVSIKEITELLDERT